MKWLREVSTRDLDLRLRDYRPRGIFDGARDLRCMKPGRNQQESENERASQIPKNVDSRNFGGDARRRENAKEGYQFDPFRERRVWEKLNRVPCLLLSFYQNFCFFDVIPRTFYMPCFRMHLPDRQAQGELAVQLGVREK